MDPVLRVDNSRATPIATLGEEQERSDIRDNGFLPSTTPSSTGTLTLPDPRSPMSSLSPTNHTREALSVGGLLQLAVLFTKLGKK